MPGNLDRLRVEVEKKNKQKRGETKAARNAVNLIPVLSCDEEGTGKRGKEGEARKENMDGKRVEIRSETRKRAKR